MLETINIYLISACEILCFPSIFISLLQSLSQRLGYFELILLLAKYRASFIAAIGFKNVCMVHCRRSIIGTNCEIIGILAITVTIITILICSMYKEPVG